MFLALLCSCSQIFASPMSVRENISQQNWVKVSISQRRQKYCFTKCKPMINFGKERNITIGIDNCIATRTKVVNETSETTLTWHYSTINGSNLSERFDAVDRYILPLSVERQHNHTITKRSHVRLSFDSSVRSP